MYGNYRAYDSSWSTRNGRASTAATNSTTVVVRENGTMGRHTSDSPPPITIGDGKRRPIRDRLHNINTAMAWIKEELEGIKEQDKTLIDIFKKVQGDVKELNGFVTNNRSSSSLQGTPSSAPPPSQPQQTPSVQKDTSLELDFDALDDEDDELSESGEHKTSSLSGGSPSPPLPSGSSRGLTDSGTSYSNIDTQSSLDFAGSRDNLSAHPTNQSGGEVGRKSGVTGVSGSKDSAPMSPTGGVSLSLGSLDIDFDFPSSFGLGTISEGRSLMNIPTTISDTSRYEDSSSTATSSGQTSSQKAGTGGLQRSVSQQPLEAPSVSDKGRNNTYQPQKKPAPQTAPKPRRGASVNQGPPPTIFSSLQRNGQLPPLSRPMAQPAISKIGRQSSESSSERISPQQARKEMMKSTPALFPSPPRSRRNTDSLPRPSNSRVMTPLLPFQAQQELREAALRAKQESSLGKKSSNGGVIPHMTPGSPILIRKGGSSKQSSPPLSAYRSTTGGGNNKHSPIHGQRNSPTSSRLYPAHLSPGGMKGSSSMTRLAPSSSYSSSTSRGTQEETTSTMSRNSSMDSGIQYISEGETGGGATTGERASNTSTTTTDSIATTTSLTSAGSGVKEPVGRNEDTATTKKKVETGGLGDFSDVLSVLSNW